jgi:hypothetical protein
VFRSRVEHTTAGRTSGASWVMRTVNEYGDTHICLTGLSVTRTRSQCVEPGSSGGGLTSTIATQPAGDANILPHIAYVILGGATYGEPAGQAVVRQRRRTG